MAPNALKGVLSAREAAAALAGGFERAGVRAEQVPVADGGEGTMEAIQTALGGQWRTASVPDPLGRPVHARWLLLPDGRAVVESAEPIGLWRLTLEERDPVRASSRGLGELVVAALEVGARGLLVGLGGTANVDGGVGLRDAVPELTIETTVLCDVAAPLLGPRGAARAYGPQKGATPAQVEELERRLASIEGLLPVAELPGAGAAGGLGAAFAALGGRLVPGAEYVLETLGLRRRIRSADLVVTGEGTVDGTTMEGKAPGAVLRICREEAVRCVVFGGRVVLALEGAEMRELSGDPARAREDLAALGEELARSL
ncbi:MAG: glycerate kinase family protein [Gaiellaceae bacterium]